MSRLFIASVVMVMTLFLLGGLPVVAGKKGSSRTAAIAPTGQNSGVGADARAQPIVTCEGFSDRPHASGHKGGTVNAQGRTKCPFAYPTIYVFAELYKNGNFVTRQQAFANNRSLDQATANVSTGCPKNSTNFRIQSYHYVVWPDFQNGTANTNNVSQLKC